jgi:hypothetical protein
LSSRTRSTGNPKKTKFKETDRVFSLSSVTSQQAIKDIGVTKSISQVNSSSLQHDEEETEILEEEDDEFYEEDLLNPNGKRKRNSNGQFKKKK